ncbi:MAG TPA: hypothetical protein PKX16_05570, partial [Kiritimatiellia bacterium]|nr:hypothetical protein [Kiritimatiellia bacterium]
MASKNVAAKCGEGQIAFAEDQEIGKIRNSRFDRMNRIFRIEWGGTAHRTVRPVETINFRSAEDNYQPGHFAAQEGEEFGDA